MLSTGTTRVRLEFLGKIVPEEPEAPPPKPATPPTTTVQVPEEKIFLQIAAFRGYENAKTFVEELSSLHPELKSMIVEQDGYFRVWLGPYPTEPEAVTVQSNLKNEGKETVLLRR
jgi:cell division protein FtsN